MSERAQPHVFENVFAVVSDHVIFEQLDENIVLLDLQSERYYELNGVGSRIWVLLQEHSDLDQVLKVMLQEYQVDEGTLRDELLMFIDCLTSQGWLRTLHGEPA